MSNDDDYFDVPDRKPAQTPSMFGRGGKVGESVVGEIVDKFTTDRTVFGTGEKIPDYKDPSKTEQQLVLVLQTEHRNWENVSKRPKHKVGDREVEYEDSDDTGRRLVYLPKGTNVFAAVLDAMTTAIPDKGARRGHPKIGAKVMVQFFEEEDVNKGNPLKKFRAKYKPGAEANPADEFDMDETRGPDAEVKPEPAKDPWATTSEGGGEIVDEPPF